MSISISSPGSRRCEVDVQGEESWKMLANNTIQSATDQQLAEWCVRINLELTFPTVFWASKTVRKGTVFDTIRGKRGPPRINIIFNNSDGSFDKCPMEISPKNAGKDTSLRRALKQTFPTARTLSDL